MDTSLKSGITLNEDAYIVLADLHLNKTPIDETKDIIENLKAHKNYSIVLLGDTFQINRADAIEHNKDLMSEINKHNPIYICGDIDPYFGYDYAVFKERTLCHGNQFNYLTRFKLINKIVSLFKHEFVNIKRDIPQYIKTILGHNRYVVGHFCKDCNICGSRCLAARTLYMMDSEKIVEL